MLGKFGRIHRVMMMVLAMFTKTRGIAKAAHQVVFLGAIVEVDVPAYRNEKHHECHQQGTDFQQVRFHAAKIIKIIRNHIFSIKCQMYRLFVYFCSLKRKPL